MIAFLEHFVQDTDPEAPQEPSDSSDVALCKSLDLQGGELDFSPSALARCSIDFGGLRYSQPLAVVRPASSEDVSSVVRAASRSTQLTVAARGNGHSISGQATAPGGLVVVMGAMEGGRVQIRRSREGGYQADVGAGVLWEEVLRVCVGHGVAPRSWTDYLGLTVGGTLSNAGISGQAFRHGPQTQNVVELEVVTGKGDLVSCSHHDNSDLFNGVLGGLGQFGIITRATVLLDPAPDTVRWVRVVYSEFEVFSSDSELLVSRPAGDSFDYVEGFAFVNSNDLVNGWDSVPLGPHQRVDPAFIPSDAGPVLYCLEVAYYYQKRDGLKAVDKAVDEKLRTLRFIRGLRFEADVGFVDFLCRVKTAEAAAKENGIWDTPHPWLNLLVSKRDILHFDRLVFKKILRHGIGGPMLVYPLCRSKWDSRTSVVLPEDGEEIFYLVALLRFNRPYPNGPTLEELLAQNQEIIDCCSAHGLDFKMYLPHYRSEEQWKRHFGKHWDRFVERKARYDPLAILAPGQRIFSRRIATHTASRPTPF